MSSPEAEKRRFARVSNLLLLSDDEITDAGIFSTEVLQKVCKLYNCSFVLFLFDEYYCRLHLKLTI